MNVDEIIKKFHALRAGRVIKEPYDQFVLTQLNTNKDTLSDNDVLKIIESDMPEPDYNILRVVIMSGILSQKNVMNIICTRQFDEGLCMLALDAYANQFFFTQFFTTLEKHNRGGQKLRRMLYYACILHKNIITINMVKSIEKSCEKPLRQCEILRAA